MRSSTPAIAERYLQARVAKRAAEARELALLVELAVEYRVADDADAYEVHLPELSEKLVPVGGDGCPLVSEFFTLELAAMQGVSVHSATRQLHRALNLRFRHPRLWAAVQELDAASWVALEVAKRCDALPAADALVVTDRWLAKQAELNDGQALDLVDELVAKQRPDLTREKERKRLEERYVGIGRYRDGVLQLSGQLDPLDGKYLDSALNQLADLLAEHEPDHDALDEGQTRGELRARALGYLAAPAQALALLQRAAQQPLFHDHQPTEPVTVDAPGPEGQSAHRTGSPEGCAGHTCGTITVDPEQLQPTATVVIHIDPDTLTTGIARIAQAGVITLETLTCLLQDRQVKIQPVIDLPNTKPEERYRPSRALREAVQFTWHGEEAFPYSSRPAARMDIDHLHAYLATDPASHTHLSNLAPLGRRVHRAKTAGHWHAEPTGPGTIHWRSPLSHRYEVTPAGTRRLE